MSRTRGLVAEFHVIHASGDAGVIDDLDDLVVEMVVVHQAAVADGAIHDLDFRAEGEPAAGGVVFGRLVSFHVFEKMLLAANAHYS
jgi:hypothetical protein